MNTCRAKPLLSPLLAALAVLVCAEVLNAAEFFALDRLQGEERKRITGISADGSVIVGYSVGGDDVEAWRWTAATGIVPLGEELRNADTKTEVYSVSADGWTVFGKRETSSGAQLFRWTEQGGFGDFVDVVLPADGVNCSQRGISADGSVVVGQTGTWPFTSVACFQAADGRFVSLGVREGFDSSYAIDVSADGSIIAGRSDTIENGWKGRTETWLWSEDGGYVDLADLGAALITSLSEDGSVAVGLKIPEEFDFASWDGSTLPSYGAFRWTAAGGMELLDTPDFWRGPRVSRDGTLVFFEIGELYEPTVWDDVSSYRNLRDLLIAEFDLASELDGWQLDVGTALNSQLLWGRGISPQGYDEMWVAILEPPFQPGDADQDWDIDQLDLVQVQVAGKYLTGQPATWGEGDWDGAPVVLTAKPPEGDGLFNQLDIVAAQQAGLYLSGSYDAERPSVILPESTFRADYDASAGHIWTEPVPGVDPTIVSPVAGDADIGPALLVPVPEPSTLFLTALAGLITLVPALRNRRP